jgi:hypothetical protein
VATAPVRASRGTRSRRGGSVVATAGSLDHPADARKWRRQRTAGHEDERLAHDVGEEKRAGAPGLRPFSCSSFLVSSGSLPSRARDREVWRCEAREGKCEDEAVERQSPGLELGRPVRIRAGFR